MQLLGYWGTCLACSPFVGSRNWRRLIDERALPGIERHTGRFEPGGREVMRRELAAVYLQFERLSTGGPVQREHRGSGSDCPAARRGRARSARLPAPPGAVGTPGPLPRARRQQSEPVHQPA